MKSVAVVITAFRCVIHILLQRAGRGQRRLLAQLRHHHTDHVPALIHQRAARISRMDRRADLEMPWVILRPGQPGNLSLGQLGRKPLQPDVGETKRRRRRPKPHAPA